MVACKQRPPQFLNIKLNNPIYLILVLIFTCDSLATAENPHVTIITNKHKLAADTHVDTAQEHDGSGHDAPQK